MTNSHSDAQALADTLRAKRLPPVADWHPERCSSIDIRIARDGSWHHEGTPIKRKSLYRLFSTVLRRDDDDEYYLVTPAEKLRIRVDDAPFHAVSMEVSGTGTGQQLIFTTNCDDRVSCDAGHPLRVDIDAASGEPSPYVLVRDRLEALIARPVFYQIVDLADTRNEQLGIWSGGCYFTLGSIRD
ncbi:MAG: DUF1285 domain-containing protein [Gammaproteobacteria bacterium]|nr:DUF1285 domain-containing protein [Gammaproteobacteria bacterium]